MAQALATPATSRLALGPAVKEAAVTAFVVSGTCYASPWSKCWVKK